MKYYKWRDVFAGIEEKHIWITARQLQFDLRVWFIKHYPLTSYLCLTEYLMNNIHKYSWPTQIKESILLIYKEYGPCIIDMENTGELYHVIK